MFVAPDARSSTFHVLNSSTPCVLVPLQRMSVVLTAPCSLLCAVSLHMRNREAGVHSPPHAQPALQAEIVTSSPCTESMFDADDGLWQASERLLQSSVESRKDASPDPETCEQKKAYHSTGLEDNVKVRRTGKRCKQSDAAVVFKAFYCHLHFKSAAVCSPPWMIAIASLSSPS